MQVFKDIQGYEEYYKVSESGVVLNKITGNVVSESAAQKGYRKVNLWINLKVVARTVHRLVITTFKEEIEGKTHINHIDGNKANNHYTNLEWVSNRENATHHRNANFKKTSKYPCVCWVTKRQKFLAQVYHNGKTTYLGFHEEEETAYANVIAFHKENNIENKYAI